MKTNQIMKRPMGCFAVEQRTKDGMFNATNLIKQWNETNGAAKELKDFFRLENTKEFLDALIEEENLNRDNPPYLSARGKNGGTWMHPILFVKFAMWLNPRFEVQVIKFVYDQMIHFRKEAGEAYKQLASAIQKIVKPDFTRIAITNIAKALNWCVFNQHESMIRNQHGDESKQRELWELERRVASLIEDGFLTSYNSVIEYLRTQWVKKHTPNIMKLGSDETTTD